MNLSIIAIFVSFLSVIVTSYAVLYKKLISKGNISVDKIDVSYDLGQLNKNILSILLNITMKNIGKETVIIKNIKTFYIIVDKNDEILETNEIENHFVSNYLHSGSINHYNPGSFNISISEKDKNILLKKISNSNNIKNLLNKIEPSQNFYFSVKINFKRITNPPLLRIPFSNSDKQNQNDSTLLFFKYRKGLIAQRMETEDYENYKEEFDEKFKDFDN